MEHPEPYRKTNSPLGIAGGKLPPQALDIERAVLGAIMLEGRAFMSIVDILRPDHFYAPGHRVIMAAMLALFDHNRHIDVLTVVEHLKQSGQLEAAGGDHAVAQLTVAVTSAAHVVYHARIIQEKWLARELIRVCAEAQQAAYSAESIFSILEETETELFALTDKLGGDEAHRMRESVQMAVTQIEEASSQKGLTGMATGLPKLDRITGGFQKSDLIIVAGRPAMGKTAFMGTVARTNAIHYGGRGVIVSAEMSHVQLAMRLIAAETEINSNTLRTGQLMDNQWSQLTENLSNLYDAHIDTIDSADMSINNLRAKIRRLKSKNGLDWVMVDYLQLLHYQDRQGRGMNREQEVSKVAQGLKNIAKELEIPVIALAQLSRVVETRGGTKRPILSDLRDSGAIEQAADIVMFLYRAEYYGFTEDEDGNPTAGIGELMIAKNRHGPLDNIRMKFFKEYTLFRPLDEDGFDDSSFSEANPQEDFNNPF